MSMASTCLIKDEYKCTKPAVPRNIFSLFTQAQCGGIGTSLLKISFPFHENLQVALLVTRYLYIMFSALSLSLKVMNLLVSAIPMFSGYWIISRLVWQVIFRIAIWLHTYIRFSAYDRLQGEQPDVSLRGFSRIGPTDMQESESIYGRYNRRINSGFGYSFLQIYVSAGISQDMDRNFLHLVRSQINFEI